MLQIRVQDTEVSLSVVAAPVHRDEVWMAKGEHQFSFLRR